jgi:hypothetical protein
MSKLPVEAKEARLMPCGVRLKAIPGVLPIYAAGADGRIWSRSTGRWKPLAAHKSERGYLSVCVCHSRGRYRTRWVHRLVCFAWHGKPNRRGLEVLHRDNDRANNRPRNLRWGTKAEQWQDRRLHGTATIRKRVRLDESDRNHLRWALDKGLTSRRHAARVLGLAESTVGAIARRGVAANE